MEAGAVAEIGLPSGSVTEIDGLGKTAACAAALRACKKDASTVDMRGSGGKKGVPCPKQSGGACIRLVCTLIPSKMASRSLSHSGSFAKANSEPSREAPIWAPVQEEDGRG